jgi:hypothetical protein
VPRGPNDFTSVRRSQSAARTSARVTPLTRSPIETSAADITWAWAPQITPTCSARLLGRHRLDQTVAAHPPGEHLRPGQRHRSHRRDLTGHEIMAPPTAMQPINDQDWLAERFEANRSHLRGVAYRMLGSVSEADDAVQEAWIRLSRTDTSDVENLRAWLTTVVGRVCLNMLRSRKTRRESSLDTHVPDPIVSPRRASIPSRRPSSAIRSGSPCSSSSIP